MVHTNKKIPAISYQDFSYVLNLDSCLLNLFLRKFLRHCSAYIGR